MVDDRKIAAITLAFCFVVLGVRLASADVIEVDALFYAGEVPSDSMTICQPYICVQPVSYPAVFVLSPYIQVTSISSYTIHLNEGWNFISIPLEVSE